MNFTIMNGNVKRIRHWSCADDDHDEAVQLMARLEYAFSNALNVCSGRNWIGLRVSMPITNVMEAVLMHLTDLTLLSNTIGSKGHTHSAITRARSGGVLDADLVSRELSKKLTASFGKPWGGLAILLKLLEHARGQYQSLARRSDGNL